MSYDAQSSMVREVQLKAQRLVLAFSVVGNATPASKSSTVDDPSVLFLRMEGTGQDNITVASGALDSASDSPTGSNETSPTYTDAADDSSGIINCLVKVSEPIKKVLRATCQRVSTTESDANDAYTVSLGDADGISANGDKILLTITGTALTSGTQNLCLEVEYSVDES